MPSPPSHPPETHHHHLHLLPILLAATLTLIIALLVLFTILFYRKLRRNRTAPSDLIKSPINNHHQQCRRFSYSLLRRATNSFSVSKRLGHGGFGSVYKAVVRDSSSEPLSLAVKVMDSSAGSLQGEREFHNELSLASSLIGSPHITSLLGFSSDRRGRRLILVYELMENRSLQDALFDQKSVELMDWNKRFAIATDIAKGVEFLHDYCDPPIIHGDIKPSNILLDAEFKAKIGDFGLARVKSQDTVIIVEETEKRVNGVEDNGSILEESESIITSYEDAELPPDSCSIRVSDVEASPVTVASVSPETGVGVGVGVERGRGSLTENCFDKVSVESVSDVIANADCSNKKTGSKRDWWWKQDNGAESEPGRVKDYVMEWIGSEIKKERPRIASPSSIHNNELSVKIEIKKEKIRKKEKNRKPREWWKEEFCDELTKKKNKKKRTLNTFEFWWQKDEDSIQVTKKRKSRRSIDTWIEGLSGELRVGRRNSQDLGNYEIPKSGGISSTPSMRGTVCYIAPECGGGGLVSEKCDVYSFGVLLLVLVSGRRPLQVTASPISEFERANLISWARQLACNGKLLDLVDSSVHSVDKDQALLCITIALLCLQKSPVKRPSMKDIVEMLSGNGEAPHLPFEFSPSPPMRFPYRSRKKAR